jgi:hypothetical protein
LAEHSFDGEVRPPTFRSAPVKAAWQFRPRIKRRDEMPDEPRNIIEGIIARGKPA